MVVGNLGTILTSPDAVNWNPSQSGTINPLKGIAYGSRRFVVVGHSTADGAGLILNSADGTNWTKLEWSGNQATAHLLNGIVEANGQFVTVGSAVRIYDVGDVVWNTVDGVTWTTSWGYGAPIGGLSGIAFGAGQFLAVGGHTSPASDSGSAPPAAILTSVDGVNWVERQLPTQSELFSVAYRNGRFVAVGNGGTILRSGPIITLALSSDPATGLISLSLRGPTGLGCTIEASANLITWTSITNITSVQSTMVILDASSAGSPQLYYRAYAQ